MLTQDRLKELFYYHPDSGDFVRLERTNSMIKVGTQAGTVHSEGYLHVAIDNKNYYLHRLAVLYSTGAMPPDEVDHINGIRNDNRITNLRLATSSQNKYNSGMQENNTSGHKGVAWHKGAGKWVANISSGGQKLHLGLFTDVKSASLAYLEAEKKHHGEYRKT